MSESILRPRSHAGAHARASEAWAVNASGVYERIAADSPAFDRVLGTGAALGLGAWQGATNQVTNPWGTGMAAGSPGTLPTGWAMSLAATTNGLTRTLHGLTVLNGITMMEFSISGIATAATNVDVAAVLNTAITVAPGELWTTQCAAAIISGGAAGVTYRQRLSEFTAIGGALVTQVSPTFRTLGAVPIEIPDQFTISNASAVRAQPALRILVPLGTNLTTPLRLAVGLHSFHRNAVPLPPILPPTNTVAASTRAADVATVPLGAELLAHADGFTVECGFRVAQAAPAGLAQTIFEIASGADTDRIRAEIAAGGSTLRLVSTRAGVDTVLSVGAITLAAAQALAVTWGRAAGEMDASLNGGAVVTATGLTLPAGLATLRYGHAGVTPAAWLNGQLRRLRTYPGRAARDSVARPFPTPSGLRALSVAA